MKNIILFASMCLALLACDKKEDETQPELYTEKQAVVALRETVIPVNSNTLKVELQSVNDSRCPEHVTCVTAGTAMLKFSVTDGEAKTEVSLDFSGVDKSKNTVNFKLNGRAYTLFVSQVLPYPKATHSPSLEEYKVDISIAQK